MRPIAITIIVAIGLVSCAPSPDAIAEAIRETQAAAPATPAASAAAQPSPTAPVSATLLPTASRTAEAAFTPRPTRIVWADVTATVEALRAESVAVFTEVLEAQADVERVNLLRFRDGLIEIELQTVWASQDSQPQVSYTVIQILAEVFADWPTESLDKMVGAPFGGIHITTYSTRGEYRYQSETDPETLKQVAARSISYEEWVEAADAGFR